MKINSIIHDCVYTGVFDNLKRKANKELS